MKRAFIIVLASMFCISASVLRADPGKDISEASLRNYDFTFGTDYWSVYQHNYKPENTLEWKDPAVMSEKTAEGKRNFLRIDKWSTVRTVMMNIKPGEVYTVTAVARCAVKGGKTKIPCFLIDGVWHIKAVAAELDDQWKKITFQQTFPFTKQNRGYFRIDTRDLPVDLASVCVVKGDVKEAVPPKTDVRFGFIGPRIFSTEENGNELKLKTIVSEQAKLPVEISLVCRDLWNQTVFSKKIKIEKAGESITPIALDNMIKGTFICEVSSGKQKELFRYAVLTPTAGKKMAFNAACGHFQLFNYPNRETFDRFISFRYNRFFLGQKIEAGEFMQSKEFREVFKRSGYLNIVNLLPNSDPKLKDMLMNRADIPEQAKKDFEAYLRRVIPCLNTEGVYGIEVFNEPYLWYFGPKRLNAVSPEKLVELMKIAYPIIRELAPNAKIIQQAWPFESFVKAGGWRYIDIHALHPYCVRPDIPETYNEFIQKREVLSKHAGHDVPVISTEQYVGVRHTPVYNHDVEYFRYSSWDTEWECAKVTAECIAHHAAAGIPSVFFAPDYLIDGFGPEAAVYHNFGIFNTAVHLYGNAGRGRLFGGVPESIRCFYFPDANPQPFAVLYSLALETEGRVLFQDPVRILNVMGNEVKQEKDGLPLGMPLYVFFPNGDGEKILERAHWLNLGNPMKIAILSEKTIDVQLTNLSLKPEPVTLEMKKYPESWQWKQKSYNETLAPKEKKTFRFQLEKGVFEAMKKYNLGLRMQLEDSFVMKPIDFSALFVPYRKDLDLKDAVWHKIGNVSVNHDKNPDLDHKGGDDLSAKFAAVWNETGLKLAVRVQDDKIVMSDLSLNSYKNDSVQVYFDMNRDATPENDLRKKNWNDDVDWLFYSDGKNAAYAYLIRNETGRHIGEANETTGIDPDVKVEFRKLSEKEVEYEIFFPAKALPQIRFVPGTRSGFSILVNDNDGKGRKAGLTLSPAGTEPIFHAASYLDMILKK